MEVFMDNWMAKKLLPHVGHNIVCAACGGSDDPDDVRIECEDCCAVLVSAEDFNEDMAGDYKVTHRLRLGGRTLLIGDNPKDEKAPYMTCYQGTDMLGNLVFTEAVGSDDYFEIAELFSERLRQQVDAVRAQRAARGLPFAALTEEHCRRRGADESLAGRLVILRASSLLPEYRTADHQLGYAKGGFGCSPDARGRAVYFKELYSGETCRWDRGDILGIADLDKLPEWAKEKAMDHEDQEGTPVKASSVKSKDHVNQ